MMYKEQIDAINEWFREHEEWGTYHSDNEYAVRADDVEEFTEMLKGITDLIGIRCMAGQSGIWFTDEDLRKASFY